MVLFTCWLNKPLSWRKNTTQNGWSKIAPAGLQPWKNDTTRFLNETSEIVLKCHYVEFSNAKEITYNTALYHLNKNPLSQTPLQSVPAPIMKYDNIRSKWQNKGRPFKYYNERLLEWIEKEEFSESPPRQSFWFTIWNPKVEKRNRNSQVWSHTFNLAAKY